MDPLAFLEKQCLSAKGENDPATSISDGSSGNADDGHSHTSEDAGTNTEKAVVVACYTYPSRESTLDNSEASRNKSSGNARSRSRSRDRETQSRTKYRSDQDSKSYGTDGRTLTDSTSQSKGVIHTVSAIDRMILRQEELLMRQSDKFLKDVKKQYNED
ncbi:hypothetical protein BaOVIS_010240 [Babesia ovis]|uniref:Uncharacterized protein n=1 Tax=Babesia ovis TaxID=5869 RepID=A0A9W5T924_BABOV|nr:hypothetical protein BaOVIS_010240 [Babesia ovis]